MASLADFLRWRCFDSRQGIPRSPRETREIQHGQERTQREPEHGHPTGAERFRPPQSPAQLDLSRTVYLDSLSHAGFERLDCINEIRLLREACVQRVDR